MVIMGNVLCCYKNFLQYIIIIEISYIGENRKIETKNAFRVKYLKL